MAAALALVVLPLGSMAATSTLNTNVGASGSVEENCTIKKTSDLHFPAYDSQVNLLLDLANDVNGNVFVQCSVGSTYKLTAAPPSPFMIGPLPGGTDHLNYLYSIGGGGAATSAGENWPITGSVTHGQNVHHGPFADPTGITITVALNTTP